MEAVLRSPDLSPIVPRELLDTEGRIVYFPVRHHSPACARLLRQFIEVRRPAAILIEGPSDFNDRLTELALPHELPIAIYSYVHFSNGLRRGAFYPFCEYSPEWQAIVTAQATGCSVRCIDLPWADLSIQSNSAQNRYSDGELRYGKYVATLCRKLGVDNFDAAWDLLIEQHANLSLSEYFARCHLYCCQVRQMEETVSHSDLQREAYMARQVQDVVESQSASNGQILVVTGGFHSSSLWQRLREQNFSVTNTIINSTAPLCSVLNSEDQPPDNITITERGIALTPYSYERMDSLRGYDAGMPSPGFYHQVWLDRLQGQQVSHHKLLESVITELRKRGQICSTADVIALETMARGLALLRGRQEIWREDLVDSIISALIKEELDQRNQSPFLAAVFQVLRGNRRGKLAEGTVQPPFVQDVNATLKNLDLYPAPIAREILLDLSQPTDLEKSRLLHRLRVLEIPGVKRERGTDFVGRRDLTHWQELWKLRWHPEFEATCIESSRYGTSLLEATVARLLERSESSGRDAESAALILLDSALAGTGLPSSLLDSLEKLTATESSFLRIVAAIQHLFYLYRYDEVLGTRGVERLGVLLQDAVSRAIWLLERLGQATGEEPKTVIAIRTLVDSCENMGIPVPSLREDLKDTLSRILQEIAQLPMIRGAAAGGLANLGLVDSVAVRQVLIGFAEPTQMGDFLAGLFAVAREMAQRNPDLLSKVDELLLGFSAEEFVAALPSFRLAFTFFTPREKHYMLTTLFRSLGIINRPTLAALAVDPKTAASALLLENRVFETAEKYGLRTGPQSRRKSSDESSAHGETP
jgi:hypothetical protein